MATQYIEDPETKEKIPFEWNKPTPPTSEDINSLFEVAKGRKIDIKPVQPIQIGEEPSGGMFGLLGKLGVKEKQFITPPPVGGPIEEPGLKRPDIVSDPVDLVQGILTGGTLGLLKTGGKLTKPVAEEALAWATYNAPALAKSIYKGVSGIIPGLSAKALEKTIPVEKAAPIAMQAGESFLSKFIPGMAKATTIDAIKVAGSTNEPIYAVAKDGSKHLLQRLPIGRTVPNLKEFMLEDGGMISIDAIHSLESGGKTIWSRLAEPKIIKPIAMEEKKSFLSKLPGMAKVTTPEMQGIIDLAKREKVSILAPDVTGNRTQALLFNAADKAIGGAGVTQKAAARTIQDMNAYSQRVLSGLGGEFEKAGLGEVARIGMKGKFDPVEKFGDDLYDIAAREAMGTPTITENTTRIVDTIRNSKDFQYLPGPIRSVLNKVFSDISPVAKVSAGTRYGGMPQDILAKLQEQGISKTMDFSELESIRRAVSKLSFHKEISGDQGNRFAKQVLEAIDKDMDLAATKAGTLAKSALDDARKFQKEEIFGVFKGETALGKPSIGRRISTIQNEDFLTIISKGNLTELKDIKKVLPESTIQNVKQAWLTDLFSRHQKDLMTPQGIVKVLNVPAAGREIDKFGDLYLKTLFNKQEFQMIDNFRKLSQHIGAAEKIAGNPSGTAQTIYTIQLITGGLLAGYGTWKESPISAATGLILTFGGPYGIAKFMTSPTGFKYMTTGIEKSPLIRDIITQSLKSAAIAGTHANIDIRQRTKIPTEEVTKPEPTQTPMIPRATGGPVSPTEIKSSVSRILPPGIISTRGILGGPDLQRTEPEKKEEIRKR